MKPNQRIVACKNCGTVWGFDLPDKVVVGGINAIAGYFQFKHCKECGASRWLDIPPGVYQWRKGIIQKGE